MNMKKVVKLTCGVVMAGIFAMNIMLSFDESNNRHVSDYTLADVTNTAVAVEECGTSCIFNCEVTGTVGSETNWYYTFDGCTSYCDSDGSNCCFTLSSTWCG